MSGTSLDGIDLAEITFSISEDSNWDFTIGVAETIPYPETWRNILKEAIHFSEGRLRTLNEEYTRYLAGVISTFISDNNCEQLDAVCSHGHTILHRPENGITFQIGNLPALAEEVGHTVVCDFRVQDVQLGGQGAPLVPMGDRMLFSEYDYCLNLGGFANCSYEKKGQRIAYDICPVNIVLNNLTQQLGLPFDDKGGIAKTGTVYTPLLDTLNTLQYYKQSPPKSLGLEWVQEHVFPVLKKTTLSPEDTIATVTEHIAIQLAKQFNTHSAVLITGGGAYNTFLLERLQHYNQLEVAVPSAKLLEYKEALIFGLLGVLRLRNEVNCLASVTGARQDHSSGLIFYR